MAKEEGTPHIGRCFSSARIASFDLSPYFSRYAGPFFGSTWMSSWVRSASRTMLSSDFSPRGYPCSR